MQDLPIDKLGPYPLIQLAAAILVLGGLGLAIYRGTRDRKSVPLTQMPPETRWFFDGPLAVAIQLLREILAAINRHREVSERIHDHVEPVGEELRKQSGLLGTLVDRLEKVETALKELPTRTRR